MVDGPIERGKESDRLAREAAEREARQLAAKYQKLFHGNGQLGRDVLEDLIAFCGVFNDIFTGNSKTYLLEGRRHVGLYILEKMNLASIEGLERMIEDKRAELLALAEEEIKE